MWWGRGGGMGGRITWVGGGSLFQGGEMAAGHGSQGHHFDPGFRWIIQLHPLAKGGLGAGRVNEKQARRRACYTGATCREA